MRILIKNIRQAADVFVLTKRVKLPVATASSETAFASRWPVSHWLGFVNSQSAAAEILAIPHFDSFFCFFVIRHFDETKTAGSTSHLISDDTG